MCQYGFGGVIFPYCIDTQVRGAYCQRSSALRRGFLVANVEAGERFEEYIRIAIAKSKTVHSPAELIRAAKLHPNTLYDLFNGVTDNPGPRTIAALARVLEVPVSDLWAVWEGREVEPPPLVDVLRELAPDLHELVILLRAQADDAVLAAVREALEERRQRGVTDDADPPDG